MPEIHARLGASKAKQWLECPRSIALEEKMNEEDESEYAAEGTQAHAYAEKTLRLSIAGKREQAKNILAKLKKTNPEMSRYVSEYLEYCINLYDQSIMSEQDPVIARVEEMVDFSNVVPGGFGTSDFLMIAGSTLHVVDFKYGKGVPVVAENNPQARLYGVGALNDYGWIYEGIDTIITHIYMPRLNLISTEKLTAKELTKWATTYVRPRAIKAASNTGEFKPGAACRFCKARIICKARTNNMLDLIKKVMIKKGKK